MEMPSNNLPSGQQDHRTEGGLKFSHFQNLQAYRSAQADLSEIVRLVRHDQFVAGKTEAYRQMKAVLGKKRADQEVKQKLVPAFSVAVLFDGNGRSAKNVTAVTGCAFCDLDHLSDVEAAFALVAADPHTLLAYRTIGGDGLRIVYRYCRDSADKPVDETAWRAAFMKGNRHYAALTGSPFDGQCAFCNALSGLSHDPQAHVSPEAEPFTVSDDEILRENLDSDGDDHLAETAPAGTHKATPAAAWKKIEPWLRKRGLSFAQGRHHDYVMHAAFLFNRFGTPLNDLLQWAGQEWGAYDGPQREATICSCYRKTDEHGTWQLALPGRRRKTDDDRKASLQQEMAAVVDFLRQQAQWRFNTWLNRAEILEEGKAWRPVKDRDLSTFYCRIREMGIKFTANDLEHLIRNRDFATDYDPFRTYFDTLPEWHEGDPDYIGDMFTGHLSFGDPDSTPFYDLMLRKFFTGMVALWLGYTDENPIVPVLCGEQHIGKTYFVRRILPPPLQSYLLPVSPSTRVDKDFEISMSEAPLMFLDEFSVSNLSKSEAYKYAATASKSYLRDSYGHFREMRERKASLIAATNTRQFIRESAGDRRYLAISLTGTADLNAHPLPYEGAYAQALYLLRHGFSPKPDREESELISAHNAPYVMTDDVEEALRTFVRVPTPYDNPEAYSAGDLLKELNSRGFGGRSFTTCAIGKAMRTLGFEARKVRGTYKYCAVLADYERQKLERIEDADEDKIPVF